MSDTAKVKTAAKTLGIFTLAMINVAAVLSIRNFPSMAEYGWSSVGWYVLGAIFFLIPLSLAGAELATGWPKGGGVYAWVLEAFGERWGFLAIWCDWSENLVWFPTLLAFIASTFAFAINPALGNDNVWIFTVMMIAFWGTTILNFFGEKATNWFGNVGVIAGTIVPATFIILLGIAYVAMGKPIQIPFSPAALLPEFNMSTLPFVATVILLFAGMEMAGFHALETRNPGRDFPRAIFLSATIILVLTMAGTLAIAIVVPQQSISLSAGIMQAFQDFLKVFNLSGLITPVAVLIAVGALVQLSTWMLGPAKGLGEVARQGNLPPVFQKHNKYGSPVAILIIQASIGTLFSLLFLFMPNVSSSYWVLSAMTVEVYCIMYLLIFAAVIKLRYSQPDIKRPYMIPGGKAGVWILAGAGFIACVYTFIVGFIPPSINIPVGRHPLLMWLGEIGPYALLMLAGTVLLSVPPFIFLLFKKPGWKKLQADSGD